MSEEQSQKLEYHISQCEDCSQLQQELKFLRKSLKNINSSPLPASLDNLTKERCYLEMAPSKNENKIKTSSLRLLLIPKTIFGALLVLTILTIFLVAVVMGELSPDSPPSPKILYTFILIAQNTFMLILSPLIIRKYKQKSSKSINSLSGLGPVI